MGTLTLFWESLIRYFSFFAWRDAVEIIFFSGLFFMLSRWLMRDAQRPLLRYWYFFMTTIMCASWMQMPTIVLFLTANAPVVIIFFLLIHHDSLQKNLVVPFHVKPAQTDKSDWIDALMPACLYALNKKKPLLIIIEHEQALEEYLDCPYRINCILSKDVLMTLSESTLFDATKAIWITSSGTLNGINVTCSVPQHLAIAATTWHETCVPLTAQSDALVLYANPITESFEVLIKKNVAEKLSATSVMLILKKHISTQQSLSGEHVHGTQNEKKAGQKPLSL